MRVRLCVALCLIFLLFGCDRSGDALDRAVDLRNRIADGNGCRFTATVSADYGDKVYAFSAKCETDPNGDLTFEVTSPTTIAGIGGKISGAGGSICFDDVALAFPTIADGQISPVSAPWLVIKTLRGGYLKDCSETVDGFTISIDDSYSEEAFRLIVCVRNGAPETAEIFWQGRRILTLILKDFAIL